MKLLDLDLEVREGVLVARLEGEVDLSNAADIRSSLAREMSHALLGLVLDLTDVRYLDSAGIRVIYELHEDLETRGQKMRLVVQEDSITSTALQIVSAAHVVGTAPNVEAALAELSRRPPSS